ncbi:amino acid permease-domain-containing protein [Fusarium flagelliforme]|uniref:Amino acid transporter n=1 Tax=Fusarium flagelliforme TaxID=2675880 RepID=A0A395MXA7_9HYPO|nr:amino acid permease-domain-containing protein [Fusarium flagelliforme]KAH7192825.1 amino acid permease-domain-containing protein [Fusarium flagelliforme]RFN52093.1 amino acid transporter [Fusarium flagelliforme]
MSGSHFSGRSRQNEPSTPSDVPLNIIHGRPATNQTLPSATSPHENNTRGGHGTGAPGSSSPGQEEDPRPSVKRKLNTLQLFMITLNGTLGAGLYVRSGQILELAGPMAIILSFVLLGVLAWAVMQCITELMCQWPIPGAVPLFVAKFVDDELGDVVAIAYWFTYSIGFAALVAISARTVSYWTPDMPLVGHVVIYAIMPFFLGAINSLEVGVYAWLEVVFGFIKITFLAVIMITLTVNYAKYGISSAAAADWENPTVYDRDAAIGWLPALIMTIPIATFAYIGVEIIAASIIEARWEYEPTDTENSESAQESTDSQNAEDTQELHNARHVEAAQNTQNTTTGTPAAIVTTIKAASLYIPIIIAVAYTASGLLVSLGIGRDDPGLPRLSWTGNQTGDWTRDHSLNDTTNSSVPSISSPFILISQDSEISYLDHAFNAFILFTTLTCANTNLYVASRTLFGITRNIRSPNTAPSLLKWFGRTDYCNVPLRALGLSVISFIWVPFLEIPGGFSPVSSFGWAVEILIQSGSVSVILVWACQCLAYIRYDYCMRKYGGDLKTNGHISGPFPYRSHWQPFLAWVALFACLFVLLICNSASIWKDLHLVPFLTAYLPVLFFLLVWIGIKLIKAGFSLQGLRSISFFHRLESTEAVDIFGRLNNLRAGSLERPGTSANEPKATARG